MKYRIVEPRILIVSSEIGSRPLGVILTVRRAVFICGDTEAIVPERMVPFFNSIVTVSLIHFIRNRTSFIATRLFLGAPRSDLLKSFCEKKSLFRL
jgi:hypothetical protein